jgi:hypothetical protein
MKFQLKKKNKKKTELKYIISNQQKTQVLEKRHYFPIQFMQENEVSKLKTEHKKCTERCQTSQCRNVDTEV